MILDEIDVEMEQDRAELQMKIDVIHSGTEHRTSTAHGLQFTPYKQEVWTARLCWSEDILAAGHTKGCTDWGTSPLGLCSDHYTKITGK